MYSLYSLSVELDPLLDLYFCLSVMSRAGVRTHVMYPVVNKVAVGSVRGQGGPREERGGERPVAPSYTAHIFRGGAKRVVYHTTDDGFK